MWVGIQPVDGEESVAQVEGQRGNCVMNFCSCVTVDLVRPHDDPRDMRREPQVTVSLWVVTLLQQRRETATAGVTHATDASAIATMKIGDRATRLAACSST